MKKSHLLTNREILLLFTLLLLWGCKEQNNSRVETLPYYNEATFTPHWIKTGSKEEKNFHQIPNFQLINQLGETVDQTTFTNKVYITNFFFSSCPGICPTMTNNMQIVQQNFKNNPDVLLLSHSVTPNKDTPSILKKYAEDHNAINNKWHLVTGNRKSIYDLGRNAYFVEEDLGREKKEDDFLHTENFVLIDKNKHIRGIYNGLNKVSVKQLIEDIKTLLKE